MILDFFTPIDETILEIINDSPKQVLGNKIKLHSKQSGFPELNEIRIAFFGVSENRNGISLLKPYNVNGFRKQFYQLYAGNWKLNVADLGDLPNGETPKDTYFAIEKICAYLRQVNIITILIGGTQDLTIALYHSFKIPKQLINIVSVDSQFDFSQDDELISSKSYMSKLIMEDNNYLHNYTNIGYQSYLNAQEELDLMDELSFDSIRLAKVLDDVQITEPVFREANIVSFDMKCLHNSADGNFLNGSPNGIDSRTICTLSKYAGISDKLNLVGFFELSNNILFHKLLAQIIWYFIEGVSHRFNEYPVLTSQGFKKYTVQMSDREIIFYQSEKSNRWWLKLENKNYLNNKSQSNSLLSCTHRDYLDACNDNLPNRWWKATKRR